MGAGHPAEERVFPSNGADRKGGGSRRSGTVVFFPGPVEAEKSPQRPFCRGALAAKYKTRCRW